MRHFFKVPFFHPGLFFEFVLTERFGVIFPQISGSSKPKFLDGAIIETWTIQAGEDDRPCPRCNGKVFEAEKMISMRHVYHKKCFSCKECQRPLDHFIACDAPDGEVVCRPCYQKKYSCSAFTLSGADMLKLLDTTTIKSNDEDKDSCPRCQGKVSFLNVTVSF